jgi:phage tail protein X
LGCHRKAPRNRITHLLPKAAVPAVAGVAAAVCLAPQALADPAPAAHAAGHSAAVAGAIASRDDTLTAVKRAAHTAAPARPASYTIRSGDSLSSIAGKVYHKQDAWPVLYWANRGKIRWANIIGEGQVLKVPAMPAKIPAAPSQLAPTPPPAPAPAPVAASSAAPAQAGSSASSSSASSSSASSSSASSSFSGASSSYEACVIARESGGNSQVMNSSGHYGLYQFSASTWSAYGGSASDFGHASAAEQHRVFSNAMAQGGQSNWSPYDGC